MKLLLSGNEAIARGAWEASCHVAAAYPGTPSTEILENIAFYKEIKAEWAPNEKVAFEAMLGAAIGGARALVAMKHVGLNVAADPLMTSAYVGVNGGLVIISADDPGMHSSQNEQDNRVFAKFAKIPLFEPSDSQEAYEFVKLAFEISEKYDTPVIVRSTTRISHAKGIVDVGERVELPVKEYVKDPQKYTMIPAFARKRHEILEKRLVELKKLSNSIEINRIEPGDTKIGIVTSGISYQYAREVFPDAIILKLGMPFPFPDELFKKFASMVDTIYVVEELEPFLEDHIRILGYSVIGKDKIPITGELNPQIVRKALKGESLEKIPPQKAVKRPPALCPGCPHLGIFFELKKKRINVMGDIGCYTLAVLPPLESIDTTVDMGFSVSSVHGFNLARGEKSVKKSVAVIGDSTFIHSGITGLIDIVYNKGFSTVIILDNHTTAMTGHQPHPATGRTIKGEPTKKIDFVELARAIGVEDIHVVDPHDLKAVRKTLKSALNYPGPSVIITDRPCVLLPDEWKKLQKNPKKVVDPEMCQGDKCGNCFRLGCPAIVWKDGKAFIDPLLCVGCDLCIQTCPFDAIHPEDEYEKGI